MLTQGYNCLTNTNHSNIKVDEFISIACSLFVEYNLPKNHPSTDMLPLETKSLGTLSHNFFMCQLRIRVL